jgi:hypothetical protein
MPLIKYPFQPQLEYDPLTKKATGIILQPKIPIFIKVNGILHIFKIEPHVDSGATRNLFPADPLDSLGIKLENSRKRVHIGIGEHQLVSYTHEVEIVIDKFYSFTTEIDFSRDQRAPLLGVESFFRFFDQVNFNMERSQLEISYSTKKN